MARLKQYVLLLAFVLFIIGCEREFNKYERPEWLTGKIYSQILEYPELSTFSECLELTGYDTIINTSGSYTVFAPSNDAFDTYFQENSMYNSVEEIPDAELLKLVKYHIVQNPWSKVQLRTLDVNGWIDTLDTNNDEPKGFKRETLLKNSDMKVGVVATDSDEDEFQIIDTLSSSWNRRIITDSRKYAPLFYQEYFDIYDLTSSDYEFYFGRSFEGGDNIYYCNAKIIGDEIFAENGFIYNVDRVVEPLENGYEILSSDDNSGSYTDFFDLINLFPEFEYNSSATLDQAGADVGAEVDSLFDLSYPDLLYEIHNEKTKAPDGVTGLPSNVAIRYHYGLVAPTNEALAEFAAEYLEGKNQWGTFENAPRHLKRIIANTYMSFNPIYNTDIENGFYNGELDNITVEASTIIDKKFGSNCSFIGVNKAIVPRVFSSVTGPIYRRQGYSFSMYAIEESGLTSALKRQGQDYSFYVESDANCRSDSSLWYDSNLEEFTTYLISGGSFQKYVLSTTDLRTLILNHVGIEKPNGVARKEFIKNLAGNYIIINNETNVVSGTTATTVGYNGVETVDVVPQKISTNSDNGDTYDISNWFSFSGADIYTKIQASYPAFHQLLDDAGLALPREYKYSFISTSEFYTVLVPSDEAINNFDFSNMTTEELQDALKLHFIQGELIFTDGNCSSGYYETTRQDEQSTEFSTIFTQVYVDTGYDVINIKAKDGSNYLTVDESSSSNVIIARSVGDEDGVFGSIVTNGVLHEIDKVLVVEELDRK